MVAKIPWFHHTGSDELDTQKFSKMPTQADFLRNTFTHQIGLNHNYKVQQYLVPTSDGSSRKKSSPSESESYKVEPDRVRVLTRLLSYESEPSRASLDES